MAVNIACAMGANTVSGSTVPSMCGRFVMARSRGDLVIDLGISRQPTDEVRQSFNIAPTSPIATVVSIEGERSLEVARWGLIPTWAKDKKVGVRAINARSETAATKPTFRSAVKKHRAIIPADGYYEWRKSPDGTKQPYFIHSADGGLMLFAGLFDWWRDLADDKWVMSTTILTRDSAGEELEQLHDRMPVFVDRHDIDEWITPDETNAAVRVEDFAARGEQVAHTLAMHPVDRRVGKVQEQGPDLIAPVAAA